MLFCSYLRRIEIYLFLPFFSSPDMSFAVSKPTRRVNRTRRNARDKIIIIMGPATVCRRFCNFSNNSLNRLVLLFNLVLLL